MSENRIKTHFESLDPALQRRNTTHYGHVQYAAYILGKIEAPKGARVLEMGCGDGEITKVIRELRPDLEIVGVDISEALITKARESNPEVQFYRRDLEEGVEDLGKFDVIFSFSVAQYFTPEQLARLAGKSRPSLKPGGRLMHLSVPDRSKHFVLLLNSAIEKGEGWGIGFIRSVWRYLKQRRSRFYSDDGSYWHQPAELEKSSSEYSRVQCVRPSDSWYRFDIVYFA